MSQAPTISRIDSKEKNKTDFKYIFLYICIFIVGYLGTVGRGRGWNKTVLEKKKTVLKYLRNSDDMD